MHGAARGEIPLAEVMKRIPPGYTLQEVDYPGGLWPWTGLFTAVGAESIKVGVPALDAAIRSQQGHGQTLVIGESLGSLVVDQELRNLVGQPDAPDPSTVHFEVIADPSRPGGLMSYLPVGWYELLTGTLRQPIPETPYDLTVIKLQYDGVASWPDRPWHLLSVINALAGGLVYHRTDHYGNAAQQVMNGEVPPEFITTTVNSQGGVTTTYAVQQKPALLHLLEPIFPNAVEKLDNLITPAINLGYHELTPDAGPYLAPGGVLVDENGEPVFPLPPRSSGPNPSAVRPSRTAKPVSTRAATAQAGNHRAGNAVRPTASAKRRPA